MWPYYYIWSNYYIKSYSPTYKYIYFKVADFSHPKLKNQKTMTLLCNTGKSTWYSVTI